MFDKFTPIDSDHIAGAHHDSMERKTYVKFKNGAVYAVHGMSPEDHQAFLDADSQGEHFHRVIKQNYHIERVK